jgi:hypothetical protein
VPSAAWHSKLDDGTLNPGQAETDDFGLQQINFLPGFAELYAGFLSPPWLIAFLAACGIIGAMYERWLFRHRSPARLVMLAGTLTAAMNFEQGLPGMLVTVRTAAVVAVLAMLASRTFYLKSKMSAPTRAAGSRHRPTGVAAAPSHAHCTIENQP